MVISTVTVCFRPSSWKLQYPFIPVYTGKAERSDGCRMALSASYRFLEKKPRCLSEMGICKTSMTNIISSQTLRFSAMSSFRKR